MAAILEVLIDVVIFIVLGAQLCSFFGKVLELVGNPDTSERQKLKAIVVMIFFALLFVLYIAHVVWRYWL